ncbi:hypothetical protein L9F63_001904, partial [Diploptera punctata]
RRAQTMFAMNNMQVVCKVSSESLYESNKVIEKFYRISKLFSKCAIQLRLANTSLSVLQDT